MQIAAVFVVFVALIAKICFAGLSIKTSKLDESLIEASIDILESCYTERFSTVGFAGPSAGSIIKRISLRGSFISATLIDENSASVPEKAANRSFPYKLQAFVVTVTDRNTLVKTLAQVKNSTWWNHMGSFLLINLAKSIHECSNAVETLWEAWKVNILNANFMCLHQTVGKLIYTFNPYMSKAPGPWELNGIFEWIDGHNWTLFVRDDLDDKSLCDKLDFDKTVDLGRHDIIASSTFNPPGVLTKSRLLHPVHISVAEITAGLLVHSLNATWEVKLFAEMKCPDKNKNGTFIGLGTAPRNGRCDIDLSLDSTRYDIDVSTYPFHQEQLGVFTHYRGDRSQLDKLISVLDKFSRFGVLVVLAITLIFFKFWQRRPLTLAILDLVLIVCNAGLHRIPRNTAPRIYLASLFMVTVTIQGIYSGQLASLLTNNVRSPTVDSYEDLACGDYTIHGSDEWLSFFDSKTFEGRLFPIEPVCTDAGSVDLNAACVGPKAHSTVRAAIARAHLARDTLGGIWFGYRIRADWPLEGRVNTVLERLTSSGILDYLNAKKTRFWMNFLESYELEDHEPELKVLTLGHLGFAFIILAIGLLCATITFIIEVATFDTRVARPRKRIRRGIQFIV